MLWRKLLFAIAAASVVSATFGPTEVSARQRRGHLMSTESYDRYCGRLPAYGFDGCGYPEFSYGPDSCWRRVIVSSLNGPRPRRMYVCG
jgi:hypothetical protein